VTAETERAFVTVAVRALRAGRDGAVGNGVVGGETSSLGLVD